MQSQGPVCTIIEANNIESVLEHAKDGDTLVIFDIDNTLLHTNQELGSDVWANWYVHQKLREGLNPFQAVDYMLDLFNHIHAHIDIYPVEDRSVAIVQQLKDLEIPTMCLTSRPSSMIDVTQEQLIKTGFVLNCPSHLNKALSLKIDHKAEMANGIVCGGMNDKGNVLAHIFEKLNCSLPEAIVFVDDKKSCVDSIGKTCSAIGADYTGIRYGYLDKLASQFDAKKAEIQLADLLKRHAFNR